jgi:zinc protease
VTALPGISLPDPVLTHHDSGLRIAVRPLPESPVASVQLWFDAGAADEPAELAGTAHFVEHMLFKGTQRRGVGEAAAAIEAAGGDLNAWTSWDDTCFHATLEASEIELALDVVFDMTSASVLDPDELEREKQVVLEEIRGYEEDPDTVAADRLHELLFGEHAYGRPVIGFPSTVRSLDRARVEAFWRSHYHPGRAVLAVAGPVQVEQVQRWIEPLVKRWTAGTARIQLPSVLEGPLVARGALERMDRDFGSVVVQFGWPGPGVAHPDLPALDVLMAALGHGPASRLSAELDLERGVASQVWADTQVCLGGGVLGAGFLGGETEQAIALAVAEFTRAGMAGLSAAAVTRARDSILSDLLFSTETAEGMAGDLAWNVARMGDPLADRKYAAAIAAVTPAAVREVARRWLEPERMRLVVIDRELPPDKLARIVEQARREVRAQVRSAPVLGKPETHTIHGARVVTLMERSEIGAVQVIGLGGQLAEEASHAGLSEAWARTVSRGAGPYDPRAFAERCDTLGAQLEAASSRSTFMIGGSFPAAHTAEVMELLGALLASPHLSEDDWDNVREEMHDDRAAMVDSPSTVAEEALHKLLWPKHPWRLPVLGTEASLEKITSRTLHRFHERVVTADNLVIAVAGGIDPELVCKSLEPHLQGLPPKRAFEVPAPAETVHGRTSELHAGKDQATILLGTRGVPIGHPDRTALSVATHILDSQSGRLFLRLREERGLAYGLWARSEVGVGGGTFSAGLSTDPERAAEALTELGKELDELAQSGPSEEEVRRVVRMMAGLAAMGHQQVVRRAYDLAWSTQFAQPYGLPALKERLAKVTPAQIQQSLAALRLSEACRVVVLPEQKAKKKKR